MFHGHFQFNLRPHIYHCREEYAILHKIETRPASPDKKQIGFVRWNSIQHWSFYNLKF